MSENCYYAWLKPSADGLRIEVHASEEDGALPHLGECTLQTLLDDAIETASYEGDWAGLVLLRECLSTYIGDIDRVLQQMAKEGPRKNANQKPLKTGE